MSSIENFVSVTAIAVSVNAGGRIVCSPNPVVVTDGETQLSFTLNTPGYAFPEVDAVVVNKENTDFPEPSVTVDASHVTLLDLNENEGRFRYTVFVVEQATGKKIAHDPIIENVPG